MKEKRQKDKRASWRAAKCCLALIQLEWCNSRLSSSASWRTWREAVFFWWGGGGGLCSRWNITIAGFIHCSEIRRTSRAWRQIWGNGNLCLPEFWALFRSHRDAERFLWHAVCSGTLSCHSPQQQRKHIDSTVTNHDCNSLFARTSHFSVSQLQLLQKAAA